MEDVKFELNEGELLSKVSRYHLYRPDDDYIFIEIFQTFAPVKENFFALPWRKVQGKNGEYKGQGDTEEMAVADCLRLIKDLPSSALE